jgi:putative ABC transport system ATP-binding protein
MLSDNSNKSEVIAVDDIVFAYPKQPPVLRIKNFTVSQGESVFLYGPSGSGKSTFLNLMAGVSVPQSGAVKLLNHNVIAMDQSDRDRFRSQHLGYIFQAFNLVPYLTVLENILLPILFGRSAGGGRVEAESLCHDLGIGSFLHRSITELSVGQQQRVAVARALLGGPEIILADEPTSALDAATREVFIKLMFKLASKTGTSIVFVSHDMQLAPLFNRAVSLVDLNTKGRP